MPLHEIHQGSKGGRNGRIRGFEAQCIVAVYVDSICAAVRDRLRGARGRRAGFITRRGDEAREFRAFFRRQIVFVENDGPRKARKGGESAVGRQLGMH
nr:hypothetical protein [Caballeronia sp. INDeC2]